MRGDGILHKAFGVACSIVLHGAFLGALMLEPSAHLGAPTASERGVFVLNVELAPADSINALRADSRVDSAESVSTIAGARSEASALGAFPSKLINAAESSRADNASQPSAVAPARRASHDEEALRSSYQSTLFAHVLRYRYYPDEARAARLRGAVRVQFAMTRDGRIMAAWVETSSGHMLLDDAALEALRRAQPLPAIPAELPDQLEVLLPLDYLPPKVVLAG